MDTGKSSLHITEDLVNTELRETLLKLGAPFLGDYRVAFREGSIDLTLEGEVKAVGPVTALYRIQVAELRFGAAGHKILFDYEEDVRSRGNLGQGLLLKAFKLQKGTVLRSALAVSGLAGIAADEKSCSVDLEQLMDLERDPWKRLDLSYGDSRGGILRLFFSIR